MKRRYLLSALAAAIALAGCATSPYGSFLAKDDNPAPLDGIASDAVRKLSASWLPAKTRLAIQHASSDPFGAVFLGALRTQGYSVLEFTPPGKAQPATEAASDAAASSAPVAPIEAVPVSYVLDRAGDLYRLKLVAGHQVISRAYLVNAGKFAPAGAWSVRQE